ncbi:hypothetical protein BH24ACT22_BH24ACT22_18800 [soil metagenome]
MKRLIVLISMLAMVLVSVSPALAQEGTGNLEQYSDSGRGNQAGEEVTLAGVLEKPDATTYMYGTHSISDASGYYALQSDAVDLDAYVGQSVTLSGTLVPGYENGQVEGGPPLVEVTRIAPVETPDERVTLSFELAVGGQPPAGTSFFGYVPAEGGISTPLTDPDGDGLYTGSMDVPQYPPGPRPVPEDVDPVTLPVQIVRTTETKDGFPLNPVTIKDFGDILMDEDKTFSASISFRNFPDPDKPGPTTPVPEVPAPADNPDNSNSTNSPEGISILPDTGGVTMTIVGIVAGLAAGGLLFAWLLSTGLLRRR